MEIKICFNIFQVFDNFYRATLCTLCYSAVCYRRVSVSVTVTHACVIEMAARIELFHRIQVYLDLSYTTVYTVFGGH